MKWTTKTEYVDIDTGEEITKAHVTLGHYIVIKTTKTHDSNNNFKWSGTRIWQKQCKRNPQQKLEF